MSKFRGRSVRFNVRDNTKSRSAQSLAEVFRRKKSATGKKA